MLTEQKISQLTDEFAMKLAEIDGGQDMAFVIIVGQMDVETDEVKMQFAANVQDAHSISMLREMATKIESNGTQTEASH